jgi:ribonuclease-3
VRDDLIATLGVELDADVLELALTHRSFAYEHGGIAHNERLEFLGDSILGQAVTVWLYNEFPDLPEGDLARRRAAVVSMDALAEIARNINLGPHIRLGVGESKQGGAEKASILSDTVEALIGATFISAGPVAAQELVLRLVAPLLADAERFGLHHDPKTSLQEIASQMGVDAPSYEVTGDGPDHARVFTATVTIAEVEASGSGSSRRAAEIEAAGKALTVLLARASETE